MIRNLFIIGTLIVNTVLLTAQTSLEKGLDSFDKLVVFGSIEVNLVKGDKESMKLESSTVKLEDISIKNENNRLKISTTDYIGSGDRKVKVTVVYKELREIKANGGAYVYANSKISGDKIILTAGSGASMLVEVELNALEAEAGQGATLSVKGSTKTQEVSANSGGVYNAYELACNNTFANANTGAVIKVKAKENLKAKSSTGAYIGYIGEPKKKDISKILGGEVQQNVEGN